MNATPAALGPIFMTLISEPESFEISETRELSGETKSSKAKYTKDKAHLLQQQALEIVLRWIVSNAKKNG
ncbi:hypothetical protein [Pseudomonas baltica]|uniref:hypothetical protein n=1 Tax=Pseudomonas baltica TaxID=2762576 RepID=UPI00289DA793|nr:hypothetical protein [Pseudomonas baltica]